MSARSELVLVPKYDLCFLFPGSSLMYQFLRKDVGIKFYHGDRPLDKDLTKIHEAIKSSRTDDVIVNIFNAQDKPSARL